MNFLRRYDFYLLILFIGLGVLAFNGGWVLPLRLLFGLPLVLIVPGYALASVLYPSKLSLSRSSRLMVSLALSLSVSMLAGLVLNYTVGLGQESVLCTLCSLSLIFCLAAIGRRQRLPPDERPGLILIPPDTKKQVSGNTSQVFLNMLLAVCLLGVGGFAVKQLVQVYSPAEFTQFYMLGIDDTAENFPSMFFLDNGQVTEVQYGNRPAVEAVSACLKLVISNSGQFDIVYRVEALLNGHLHKFSFGDGTEFDGFIDVPASVVNSLELYFAPIEPGDNQLLEIWLYSGDTPVFSQPLKLVFSTD
ncbi:MULTISPECIES: DUF1616 domain-containing protein [Dehalococcoides]|jgi:uncharacterized membrane protein|uniref:DUF1616 domain-containing protein n=1 Tax=Dehalococcoides TaxID=61434 RepID=UPI0003C812CB|nr:MULTISPECIES: DUF1616 domain-containing protein [Dehalococcoides]AHB12998.1 putative membrane protein [Dehalococcoides mccartyi GY50]AII57455.1 hypothetical protein X792_01400 [Dehalococcoides mccartyi CG1]APH11951.1 hypothetical protein ASJ33_01675 [Dehalococcoides mccartyi]QYY58504.1 DUF1616 domain-containing protein [Dehalococcoides mccartyi]BAQ34188.1 putative membrane protein [Dehalococcoides sp. UCH007]